MISFLQSEYFLPVRYLWSLTLSAMIDQPPVDHTVGPMAHNSRGWSS